MAGFLDPPEYQGRHGDGKDHQGGPLSVFHTEQHFRPVSSQEETEQAEEHEVEEERRSLREFVADFGDGPDAGAASGHVPAHE